MSAPHIEYAGGYTLDKVRESRAAVIARAPAWWRKLSQQTERRLHGGTVTSGSTAGPRPSATLPAAPATARRWDGWGWVAGMCAPGVSTPAFSHRDGERLPEQFTPECWEQMYRDVCSGKREVPLTWGHGGKVLASTRNLDLVFMRHRLFGMGLVFNARLRAGVLPDGAAEALTTSGVGVSIGFVMPEQRIVERSGVGRVRVVTSCVLDHVALIGPGSTSKPAYAGARCFGIAGKRYGCPPDVRDRAEVYAYRELQRQAGINV